jgi:hypothetical protein
VFFTSASEAVMRAAILIETLQLYATILPPRLKNPLQRNLSSSRTIVYRRLGFQLFERYTFSMVISFSGIAQHRPMLSKSRPHFFFLTACMRARCFLFVFSVLLDRSTSFSKDLRD